MYKNTAAHVIDALHKNHKKETNRAPLGTYISGEPMERIALDIFGPLPVTKQGNKYIFYPNIYLSHLRPFHQM